MISTADFKTGITFKYEDQLWMVIEFQHVKPGKGAAFVRSRLRNLRTKALIDKTFRAGEKMEKAQIDKESMVYSYSMSDTYVFMNNDTYEQLELQRDQISDVVMFLIEGMNVQVTMYDSEILGISLPEKVILTVAQADPAVKGNTATSATKTAVLETGHSIQVPLFVNTGDKIVVNTTTGKYDTRA